MSYHSKSAAWFKTEGTSTFCFRRLFLHQEGYDPINSHVQLPIWFRDYLKQKWFEYHKHLFFHLLKLKKKVSLGIAGCQKLPPFFHSHYIRMLPSSRKICCTQLFQQQIIPESMIRLYLVVQWDTSDFFPIKICFPRFNIVMNMHWY